MFANWLALRIYEDRPVSDAGLWLNRASADNLLLGLAGGVGSACLVLAPPLLVGAAHIVRTPAEQPSAGAMVYLVILLAAGAAGEELFFRGYGFQLLLARCGPYATILPVGVVFALLHSGNPSATWFGIANTAGFGILFGYALLRSRDLWLPIGLHFGWNFTLPLFGVNVSGLRMKVTGYEMSWTAGHLWSGGDYGPEASLLTSVVLFVLFAYLWKAPIRRQPSPLTDPPAESAVCEPSPPPPSSRACCRRSAFAGNKLSMEDRIELTRGLMAEYGTVKVLLPRSRKPLEFDAKTGYDKSQWAEIAKESGPAARTGDLVQVTKVDLEDDKIVLQINGGFKGGRKWYDNVQVGMGGATTPISPTQFQRARRHFDRDPLSPAPGAGQGGGDQEDAGAGDRLRPPQRHRNLFRDAPARSTAGHQGQARHRGHEPRAGSHGARPSGPQIARNQGRHRVGGLGLRHAARQDHLRDLQRRQSDQGERILRRPGNASSRPAGGPLGDPNA